MAKLWDKGYSLDALIERFTVGNDYLLDRRLVGADAVASIAHARMLAEIGILSRDDLAALEAELRAVASEAVGQGVTIERGQEDGHTYIEERLVNRVGEAGKRIHTGRSRNDQVIASTRLFAREGALAVRGELFSCTEALLTLAGDHERTPMPGRTHMQPAMPSTVGLWAASYAEALLDVDELVAVAYRLLNRSPLGAAASFGVPLPLRRELVADLLGFAGVHHNVLAAVSSRGQNELALLDALEQVGLVLSRFASDLIFFSVPEIGYFSLPDELCSGSSIMPQKRNPDGLELLRGKSAGLSAFADQVRAVVRSLPSAYNRDVQETKEPLIRALDAAIDMLSVAARSAESLVVHEDRLRSAFTPEIYATDLAVERVRAGESFRDAYRAVAASLGEIDPRAFNLDEIVARRSSTGSPGNLDLAYAARLLGDRRADAEREWARVEEAIAALAGGPLPLYPGAPPER